ncbi:hypothetical protein ACFX12_039920 [Malus domestica]
MVQRKVPNKLGIQADHDKFEKQFSSLKASSQFQDGKHRGADLKKKKMKKSRSIKLSDVESMRSSPLRKNLSQPGRPPPQPLNVPNTAASPQKQPLTKTTYGSPNYMKPTSCSHARKEEQSQVSLRSSPPIFSDSKNQNRKNSGSSKLSSNSSKPERSLARTSGFKLVRTLMKSPSFKPARALAKKTSRVALCADVNVQRATCSSTLKDTKFPDYLTISPGGTEAEGTSIMKVCPYMYCSLNGHYHSPVPPLKSFLSARRRSLKIQKMMKLQALSPHGAKRCNDGIQEPDFQKMLFDENEKVAEKEAALDFFVGIYATNEEDDTEAIGRKSGDLVGEQDGYEGPVFPNDASDEAETENYANSLVVENLLDRSPHSESESEAESFEEFPEEDQKEDADEDYGPQSDQEDNSTGSCLKESDSEDLSSTEMDYSSSESIDMEWEEGQFATTVLGDYESVPNAGCSTKIQDTDKQEESLINSDAMKGNSDNMIQDYYGVLQNDGDVSEQDVIKQNFEIQESEQEYERWSYDQLSYTEDSFEGGSELSETDCIEISSTEEPTEELTGTGEEIQEQNECFEAEDHEIGSHLGHAESNYPIVETDEASENQPKNTFHEDETSTLTGDRISIPSQDSCDTDDAETDEGCNGSPDLENSETNQNVAPGDFGLEPELPTGVPENQMEATEQIGDVKPSPEIQLSDSVHDASEADEDAVKVDDYDNGKKTEPFQHNDIAEDGNLSKGKYTKPKISSSNESEDQSDIRLKKSDIFGNNTGEPDNMEVENNSEPEATKNFNMANNSISPGKKRKFSEAASNFDQQLPNTYNYWKRIKCKKLNMDGEEQRKFNPREPNYLPLVPDPEPEKVDLRHQIIDNKKNTDEWMLDYALQQAVTKLAPARKKKVALLVAAFETVMPAPKVEKHLRHTSTGFSHARPMQACS